MKNKTIKVLEENEKMKKNLLVVKLSLYANVYLYADTLYENLEVSTQKLLELMNELSQVAQYKINIQESVVPQHTLMKYQEEKKKCLGINLTN